MPRINLSWGPLTSTVSPAAARRGHAAHLHLKCRVLIESETLPRPAVVDTGAPLSVFPTVLWEKLKRRPGGITFLRDDDAKARRLRNTYTLLGATYAVVWGWLPVTPVDADDGARRLATTRVLAAFCLQRVTAPVGQKRWEPARDDAGGLKDIVMGLSAGVLEGRYLILSPPADETSRSAWLQDEPPAEPVGG